MNFIKKIFSNIFSIISTIILFVILLIFFSTLGNYINNEKAIEIITNTTSDILRVIDKYTSIRNGKYGHYIYFNY